MNIPLKTHKILWGRSGGKCAICKNELIIDPTNLNDDPSIVGDEAHIIAKTESFTRGDYDSLSPEDRNHYSNLILLCKIHHKQIDDQSAEFTVEKLRELKTRHEAEVKEHLTDADKSKEKDDLTYAGYVDEWAKRAQLDNWREISSCMSADTASLPRSWYEAQYEFITWFIARIWPHRYPLLESALYNYKAVLQDFLNVFDEHSMPTQDNEQIVRTEKFYKINHWDRSLYDKLLKEYSEHDQLVNDLFFELTRAANYVCDRVRETIFEGYRIVEGALLIERHHVGFGLTTQHIRAEYRGGERTDRPYPGLLEFKKIRYTTRDYALDPGDS